MSVENITNPVWQIFEPEQIDLSITEYEEVEYREVNVGQVSGLTKFEMETRDKDRFIRPSDGYIDVRYKITTDAAGINNIPATDIIGLQNNLLSLIKNSAYYIEDQLIEYCDYPAQAYLVKNLSEFSRSYAESAGTNQQFYLDTKDEPTTPYCNVRFFNNTDGAGGNAQRIMYELFLNQQDSGGNRDVRVIGATSANTWANGDQVVAYVDVKNYIPPVVGPPAVAGTLTGKQVVFTYSAVATTGTRAVVTFTLDANGTLVPNVGVDTNIIEAYVSEVGVPVNFFRNGIQLITQATGKMAVRGAHLAVTTAAGGADGDIITANALYPDSYNIGFYKRQQLAKNVAVGDYNLICGRIPLKDMFLFCRGYDKISRGLRHRVVLNKQDNNQMLFRFGGADRYVIIKYISMWIPSVKPDLNTLKMIESKLTSNDLYTVNFTDLNCWRTPNVQLGPANQAAIQLSNTTKKPIRVWVCFQKVERTQASQTINKMVFDHLFITNIQVRLNGRIFPMYEYKFNVNNNLWTGYHRAYTALMNSGYKMHDYSDGSLLDVETFASLYPIFYFDLTAQEEDLFKANKYAELEVRWSNQANLQAPNGYHMYVVYECERVIKFKGISGTMALEL